MQQTLTQTESMSKSEWLLLGLLVASVLINYIDRGNLSMAAPLIQKDLGLSALQIGSLLSAFFWTYSLMQLFGAAGWFADRFPVGVVFASGLVLWSAATLATGFLTGYAVLYALRLVLGVGESVSYPCYSKIFATHLPQHHRGRANALLDAGTKLGPAVGTFLAGILLVDYGWRIFFISLGAGSLLWLIPWFKFMPKDAGASVTTSEALPSTTELLNQRSAWGTFIGVFCAISFGIPC